MELLIFLLALVITWCLLMALGVGVFWWKLDRANRVVPSQSTPAPMWWLASPTRSAQLHRRLRTAVAPGHVSPRRRDPDPLPGSVARLRRDLESQAVTVDHHLVMVAHRPRSSRKVELAALDLQVRRVEDLSIRVAELERGALPIGEPGAQPIPATDSELDRLAQSVAHHEQAHDELTALERANGLVALDAYLQHPGGRQQPVGSLPTAGPSAMPNAVSRQPQPIPRSADRARHEPPRS